MSPGKDLVAYSLDRIEASSNSCTLAENGIPAHQKQCNIGRGYSVSIIQQADPLMVAIDIEDQTIIVRTQGLDEWWCFRSRVDFQISSVTKIYKKPERFPRPWLRTGGTYFPWLIMAGRFRRKGKKEFWLSKFGRESIVFDMEGEEFDRVVVNVVDPDLVIARLSEKVNERWGKEEKKEKMIEVEATSMSPKTIVRLKA